ncbi:IQ domain-containing protein E isoform X3 [Erinaceus europaeus]|uniref:IQ domain-containing protein E isoform X3 n=1 Tax=Erinaceus europaeus TaxID=9365 RepID=A0ABM3VY02_ERIEU|nr:IQ domain-containing protein E isoform X3 [Erinaceus europaeus]
MARLTHGLERECRKAGRRLGGPPWTRGQAARPEPRIPQGCPDLQSEDALSASTFDSGSEAVSGLGAAQAHAYSPQRVQGSARRPLPTSLQSPYYSRPRKVASWRSLRSAASVPVASRMSPTPQKLWLAPSKQAGAPPSHVHPAGHVPGTPAYREKEAMYEEILELKKSLHVQKGDMDVLRARLQRLQEENSRKDRQMRQLLEPSHGPEFVRTLVEKWPDAGWVINGLKQRILKLEQQCKDKDSIITKLQSDLKTTSLEEMHVAMEACYEEIRRLQTLLAASETTSRKPPLDKRSGLRRQKVSSALLSLSRDVQELTEENQSLKEDLDRLLSSDPSNKRGTCPATPTGDTAGDKKSHGYVEWSKPRLLRRITELEKRICFLEAPKLHSANHPAHRQPRQAQDDTERLRVAVRTLRGERSTLQTKLLERDLEVRQLLKAKADLQKELQLAVSGEQALREMEAALREEIQVLTGELREHKEAARAEKARSTEVKPEPPPPPCSPSPPSLDPDPDSSREGCSQPASSNSEDRRAMAARILQAAWRGHSHRAAVVLQAAVRGHLARARLLSHNAGGSRSPSSPAQSSPPSRAPSPQARAQDALGLEEAITCVQSALRAHLTRTGLSFPGTGPTARSSPAPATHPGHCSPPHLEAVSAPSSPRAPSPGDDSHSDDSDEVVIAPAPRSSAPPPEPPAPALSLWVPGLPGSGHS